MSLSYHGIFKYAGRSIYRLLGIVLHYANNAGLRMFQHKPGRKRGKVVTNMQVFRSCIEIHISFFPFLNMQFLLHIFLSQACFYKALKLQPVLHCLKARSIIVYVVCYRSNLNFKIRFTQEDYRSLFYIALLGAIPRSNLQKRVSQGFDQHIHTQIPAFVFFQTSTLLENLLKKHVQSSSGSCREMNPWKQSTRRCWDLQAICELGFRSRIETKVTRNPKRDPKIK